MEHGTYEFNIVNVVSPYLNRVLTTTPIAFPQFFMLQHKPQEFD